jgi:hypothetical protein
MDAAPHSEALTLNCRRPRSQARPPPTFSARTKSLNLAGATGLEPPPAEWIARVDARAPELLRSCNAWSGRPFADSGSSSTRLKNATSPEAVPYFTFALLANALSTGITVTANGVPGSSDRKGRPLRRSLPPSIALS